MVINQKMMKVIVSGIPQSVRLGVAMIEDVITFGRSAEHGAGLGGAVPPNFLDFPGALFPLVLAFWLVTVTECYCYCCCWRSHWLFLLVSVTECCCAAACWLGFLCLVSVTEYCCCDRVAPYALLGVVWSLPCFCC